MKIYVIRHGQTDWNVMKKIQGKVNTELNLTGKEQALKAEEILKDKPIDIIICSPLKRAKQTAELVKGNRNIQIIDDERISERDFGEFEGKKRDEFNFKDFWNYDNKDEYVKVENIKEFFTRVYAFLDEIKIKYEGKNILLVTHGGVSIPISCYFNGIPSDGDLLTLVLKNAEVREYKIG